MYNDHMVELSQHTQSMEEKDIGGGEGASNSRHSHVPHNRRAWGGEHDEERGGDGTKCVQVNKITERRGRRETRVNHIFAQKETQGGVGWAGKQSQRARVRDPSVSTPHVPHNRRTRRSKTHVKLVGKTTSAMVVIAFPERSKVLRFRVRHQSVINTAGKESTAAGRGVKEAKVENRVGKQSCQRRGAEGRARHMSHTIAGLRRARTFSAK
jgi:hypothetical protein